MATWRPFALLLTLTAACAPGSGEEPFEEEWSGHLAPEPLHARKKPCAPGVSLLADIRSGPMGSRPRELIVVDGELFFTAEDGRSGRELWKSSGSHGGGTVRVKDLRPGAATSIIPPHAHTSLQSDPRAGMPLMSTVGFPGSQGAGVTGRQGCGVSTPIAAAVAAITMGLAGDEQVPKGSTFTIGA